MVNSKNFNINYTDSFGFTIKNSQTYQLIWVICDKCELEINYQNVEIEPYSLIFLAPGEVYMGHINFMGIKQKVFPF
mgnify:CR=1 FL=1